MRLNYYPYVIGVFACLWFSAANAQPDPFLDRITDKSSFVEDVLILKALLVENHPGLYTYISKDQFDNTFEALINMPAPISYTRAYSEMARIIDVVGDGHTGLRLDPNIRNYIRRTQGFIPFDVQIASNKILVASNYGPVQKGQRILSVNGISDTDILEKLRYQATCDGMPRDTELAQVEKQFSFFFGMAFGFTNAYELVVVTQGKHVESITVPAEYGHLHEAIESFAAQFSIEDGTGWLKIDRFHGLKKPAFSRFLDDSFEQMREEGIEELVIDIRGNGGGKEGFSNILLSRLTNSIQEKYACVEAVNMKSNHYKYMDQPLLNRTKDLVYRTFEFSEDGDQWKRRSRFDRSLKTNEPIFQGKVFILIDEWVFSEAAEFVALANEYVPNCVLVGTETRGSAYVNSSGYYYHFRLPNTGLVVDIPRVRFELNVTDYFPGRGVIPDFFITDSDYLYPDSDPFIEFLTPLLGKYSTTDTSQ